MESNSHAYTHFAEVRSLDINGKLIGSLLGHPLGASLYASLMIFPR